MLMLILLFVLLLSLFFFDLDGRTSPSLSSHLTVTRQSPNIHIKQYLPCNATSGKSIKSPFSSCLFISFCMYLRVGDAFTPWEHSDSALVRSCQDNVGKRLRMSLSSFMVADALHLVSSDFFCIFIAIKSAISRPALLQCWGRNGLLLPDLSKVTSQHVQAQIWGFIWPLHQMSGDCCISSSVNKNVWGCFRMFYERNRWRKSCAFITVFDLLT